MCYAVETRAKTLVPQLQSSHMPQFDRSIEMYMCCQSCDGVTCALRKEFSVFGVTFVLFACLHFVTIATNHPALFAFQPAKLVVSTLRSSFPLPLEVGYPWTNLSDRWKRDRTRSKKPCINLISFFLFWFFSSRNEIYMLSALSNQPYFSITVTLNPYYLYVFRFNVLFYLLFEWGLAIHR